MACRELQGCASFSKLLQAVLELGNHLNQVRGLLPSCLHSPLGGSATGGGGIACAAQRMCSHPLLPAPHPLHCRAPSGELLQGSSSTRC